MTPEERKEKGPLINGLRDAVAAAVAARKEALADAALDARLASERVDVSLPVRESPEARGRIHPISQVIDEITAIFGDMGFSIAEGPDIESDDLNFTKLNFPEGHPAREMHDTFFFAPDRDGKRKLLRTHTSPVQVRTMLNRSPRSASSARAAPIAATPTRRTPRCSTRSRASSSTRARTSAI